MNIREKYSHKEYWENSKAYQSSSNTQNPTNVVIGNKKIKKKRSQSMSQVNTRYNKENWEEKLKSLVENQISQCRETLNMVEKYSHKEYWESLNLINFICQKVKGLHTPAGSKKQYLVACSLGHDFKLTKYLVFENTEYQYMDEHFKYRYRRGYFELKPSHYFSKSSSVHTELQLMYGKAGEEFIREAKINNEILLIYSYYIPCQDNEYSDNNCAANMADYFSKLSKPYSEFCHQVKGKAKRLKKEKPKGQAKIQKYLHVITAYDEVFKQTNKTASEINLERSNIGLVRLHKTADR